MSSGEIGLASKSSEALEKGTPIEHNVEKSTIDLDQRDVPGRVKEVDSDPSKSSSTSATPIVYRNLTFDAELPFPVIPKSTAQPPAPPNLKPYDSPFTWSSSRKNVSLAISCTISVLAAYSAGSYAMPAGVLEQKWHVSAVAYNTGITAFCLGFGISPMAIAPFSEIKGRRPVFITSGIVFCAALLGCSGTDSFAGMIVARAFVGVGSSTFAAMVGGILSDIYRTEERNTPMALYSGTVLFGTGLGPFVGGFIVANTSWRWVFYSHGICVGLVVVVAALFFKETRGSVLLSRKARVLNKWYEELEAAGYAGVAFPQQSNSEKAMPPQRIRWKVKSDEERASLLKTVSVSLYRPFFLLFTEPVVFFFSLWASFAWGVLYLQFSAITLVFRTNHSPTFSTTSSIAAIYAAIITGSLLSTIISIYQEKLALRYAPRKLTSTPEGRLYFACVESIFLPIGLFWFGWTQFRSVHWIAPVCAIGCATIGIFSIYLAVFNYLADTYGAYASSAIAAQSFCRNVMAAFFPLVAVQMFKKMTFEGASSFLGGMAALLTAVPWVLVFYGPKIRRRSKFASDLVEGGG
ncbi:MAG: hypothetical protein Q9160_006153 [Pyrenula sp. 1 TL-2023]